MYFKFSCGLVVYEEARVNAAQDQLPVMPLAVWALVLGILSLVFCCLPLAIPAIICGHVARSRLKQAPDAASGSGMALAGLIIGYVSVVACILACVLGVVAALTIPAAIKMIEDAGATHAGIVPAFFRW